MVKMRFASKTLEQPRLRVEQRRCIRARVLCCAIYHWSPFGLCVGGHSPFLVAKQTNSFPPTTKMWPSYQLVQLGIGCETEVTAAVGVIGCVGSGVVAGCYSLDLIALPF